jgi:predicted SnoaL-like aldol condensation-catalyzing enzyme
MPPSPNKALILDLYKEGFQGDPRGLNRFFAPNYRDHAFFGDLRGLKAALHAFRSAYPYVVWTVEHVVAEGDKVAVHASVAIRSATGTARSIASTSIYRIAQGKIVEHWGNGEPLF